MSRKRVEILTPDRHEEWDAFVRASDEGSLFSTSGWLEGVADSSAIFVVRRGDRIVAGAPLGVRPLPLGLRLGGHPPLTPYLGVLFEPSEAKPVETCSARKDALRLLAPAIRDAYHGVQLRFAPGFVDVQPFLWEGFTASVRYTYILSLTTAEEVWNGMSNTRRSDIRRAEKDGLTIDTGAPFADLWRLVERTFHRQERRAGFGAAAGKVDRLLTALERSRTFIAREPSGRAIAGAYICWDWRRAYYLLGGYDADCSHHGASALALWHAIRFSKEELGLDAFDFEGSMVRPIERFFRKFGGDLTPYFEVRREGRSIRLARRLRGWLR